MAEDNTILWIGAAGAGGYALWRLYQGEKEDITEKLSSIPGGFFDSLSPMLSGLKDFKLNLPEFEMPQIETGTLFSDLAARAKDAVAGAGDKTSGFFESISDIVQKPVTSLNNMKVNVTEAVERVTGKSGAALKSGFWSSLTGLTLGTALTGAVGLPFAAAGLAGDLIGTNLREITKDKTGKYPEKILGDKLKNLVLNPPKILPRPGLFSASLAFNTTPKKNTSNISPFSNVFRNMGLPDVPGFDVIRNATKNVRSSYPSSGGSIIKLPTMNLSGSSKGSTSNRSNSSGGGSGSYKASSAFSSYAQEVNSKIKKTGFDAGSFLKNIPSSKKKWLN